MQRALRAESWAADATIRVRVAAVHSGEAVERDGDYFGPAVNLVARLRGVGARRSGPLGQRATTEIVRFGRCRLWLRPRRSGACSSCGGSQTPGRSVGVDLYRTCGPIRRPCRRGGSPVPGRQVVERRPPRSRGARARRREPHQRRDRARGCTSPSGRSSRTCRRCCASWAPAIAASSPRRRLRRSRPSAAMRESRLPPMLELLADARDVRRPDGRARLLRSPWQLARAGHTLVVRGQPGRPASARAGSCPSSRPKRMPTAVGCCSARATRTSTSRTVRSPR